MYQARIDCVALTVLYVGSCDCHVTSTGDDIMSLTECSEDQNIALYHNKHVREQCVDFYCYHMAQGWPDSCPLQI